MTCCPTCGQTLPEELPEGVKFHGKIKAQILQLVRAAGKNGIVTERLWQAVWGDNPNGGPIGFNAISVHVSQMNRELKKHGFRVRNTHCGNGAGGAYVLMKIV